MGDPRNWSARKQAEVRAENAAADRGRLREATLYEHSAAKLAGRLGPNFMVMHPCDTFRVFRFQVHARCVGCAHRWEVTKYDFDDGPLAHRWWPAVMLMMVCPRCTSCPDELRFRSDDGGEVGAISTSPDLTLHVANSTMQLTRKQASRGEPDPFAQHDDGEAA